MFISAMARLGPTLMTTVSDPPAGERIFGMAREMGRAVARDMLGLDEAYAACINCTLDAERDGSLGAYKADDIIRGLGWFVRRVAEQEDRRRDLTRHRIQRVVRRLITEQKPTNALRAEAHGVNGLHDFPLTEPEVDAIVYREVWFARRRGHG